MSIEKQYYTPSLKEFHQGFRYEINWNNMRFDKEVFGLSGLTLEGISQRIKSGLITVKSLDHDDIIEAGWELIEDGKHIVEFMIKGSNEDTNIYLTYRTESDFIEIHNNGDNIEDHIYYFQGTVKNYNKLLDVMEMLGITANS